MTPKPQRGHEALPHTADVILEAWAPSLDECVAEAVIALVDSFVDVPEAPEQTSHTFVAPAGTAEATLVTVLEEALYVLDMLGKVPVATTVDSAITGQVSGSFALADVADDDLKGSVPKGVSLSGLVIGETDGRWRCRFTVDV
jgi:SHS2 domain-containing protein